MQDIQANFAQEQDFFEVEQWFDRRVLADSDYLKPTEAFCLSKTQPIERSVAASVSHVVTWQRWCWMAAAQMETNQTWKHIRRVNDRTLLLVPGLETKTRLSLLDRPFSF